MSLQAAVGHVDVPKITVWTGHVVVPKISIGVGRVAVSKITKSAGYVNLPRITEDVWRVDFLKMIMCVRVCVCVGGGRVNHGLNL